MNRTKSRQPSDKAQRKNESMSLLCFVQQIEITYMDMGETSAFN